MLLPWRTTAVSKLSLYVVFGAAVKPDGSPSGTLRRRTMGAWKLANENPHSTLFLSGGQGKFGRPESHVMRELLLDCGASQQQLIVDDISLDTLDTVAQCSRYLRENPGFSHIYVCSSPYHNPRCWLLLRMFGVKAQFVAMPSDRPALGWRKWIFYYFRECAALPWDVLMAWTDKRRAAN